jgi:hypothetical protein
MGNLMGANLYFSAMTGIAGPLSWDGVRHTKRRGLTFGPEEAGDCVCSSNTDKGRMKKERNDEMNEMNGWISHKEGQAKASKCGEGFQAKRRESSQVKSSHLR